MSIYTQKGGLKKLLKDFNKDVIARMFIELQRKIETSLPNSPTNKSPSNSPTKKVSSTDKIPSTGKRETSLLTIQVNEDKGNSPDNSFYKLNPSPLQVIIKPQVHHEYQKKNN